MTAAMSRYERDMGRLLCVALHELCRFMRSDDRILQRGTLLIDRDWITVVVEESRSRSEVKDGE